MRHPTASHRTVCILAIFLLLLTACSASSPANLAADPSANPFTPPAGTSRSDPASAAPTDSPTASSTAQSACPVVQEAGIKPDAVLELGPGPGIPPTTAAGEKLVIVGAVYAKDCTPLEGATLNVWQTDTNGEYGPGHGTNDMQCCYLMGSLQTDSGGRYQLITVRPAHYKGENPPPPAHIHVEISHPQAGQQQTEIVFDGDPYLPENLQNYILVTLETALEPDKEKSYLHGVATIVMNR